jgi:GRIP and coiled-coil domain-containing protein 1
LYNAETDCHRQNVDNLQAMLNTTRDQHRHELDQLFHRKRAEINELECELEKQRDRTVRLLEEKDRELDTLKKQLLPTTNSIDINDNASNELKTTTTILSELFPQSVSSTIGGPMTLNTIDNNNLLYFIQEQQMREQELVTLRKQRHELETTIRDLHKKYTFEMSQLQINNEQLHDDLERMQLSEQRKQILTQNEHNIDYIKNVFYHYLLANDVQVKHTMANALMTILQFSNKEKSKIESQKITHSLTTATNWFSKN